MINLFVQRPINLTSQIYLCYGWFLCRIAIRCKRRVYAYALYTSLIVIAPAIIKLSWNPRTKLALFINAGGWFIAPFSKSGSGAKKCVEIGVINWYWMQVLGFFISMYARDKSLRKAFSYSYSPAFRGSNLRRFFPSIFWILIFISLESRNCVAGNFSARDGEERKCSFQSSGRCFPSLEERETRHVRKFGFFRYLRG